MPYNTRRKSLSLSELGIQVPKRSRAASASQPSPPSTVAEEDERPFKKPKQSHGSNPPSPGAMSPPQSTNIRVKTEAPHNPTRAVEQTPPPSPGATGVHKIDTEGINDDIVIGVIQQLEKTGNRPHLVKELAAILAASIHAIEKSANPCALISSRVTNYLNRSWPTVSPCPLAKVQTDVHPRRLYFYLTTSPRQPFPEFVPPVPAARRIITPSVSSAGDEAEEKYMRERTQLSPSPEVDLSSPELDDDSTSDAPGSTFSGRSSLPRDHPNPSNLSHNRRAESPPLEREERDFKQTANELQQQRRNSQQQDARKGTTEMQCSLEDSMSVTMSIEGDENDERRCSEAAAFLFGDHDGLSTSVSTVYDLSSPAMKPQHGANIGIPGWGIRKDLDAMSLDADRDRMDGIDTWGAWGDNDVFRNPENVELDELEDLFDAY